MARVSLTTKSRPTITEMMKAVPKAFFWKKSPKGEGKKAPDFNGILRWLAAKWWGGHPIEKLLQRKSGKLLGFPSISSVCRAVAAESQCRRAEGR